MAVSTPSDLHGDEPGSRVEVVDESRIPSAVDAAIRTLLCTCFPDDEPIFRRTRYWHDCAPLYSAVLAEGGRMLGHVGVIARTIRWGPAQVLVAGIQNVAVHPGLRGRGQGARLMAQAMEEARRRELKFGLLFCLPRLENFYRSLGWVTIREPVVVTDANGNRVSADSKNICMALKLTNTGLPHGPIDLLGRDW